ncbi:DSS1/SEM1 family-domain-containing protein [Powellomyces hirtus]|nr:DSS1/SEM1 family-domain-containing protein [Powellomyces hirtus]
MSAQQQQQQQQQQAAQQPQQSKPPQLTALIEDDEFEDFAVENWTEADEDHEDAALWDDNWDDDDVNDDFTRQLRAELMKPAEQQ